MYKLTDRQKQLGLGAKGVTKYFSDNCGQEDSDKINRFVCKSFSHPLKMYLMPLDTLYV